MNKQSSWTAVPRAEHRKGVALMVGATLCWASAGLLVRNMTLKDSWEITFWRSLFMMLAIGGYLLARRWRGRNPPRLHVDRAALISGGLWAAMYICFLVALGHTTVANTLVLCSVAPFFAALAGHLFLREHVSRRTWIAMGVSVAGIGVMFAGSVGGGGWLGNLIAILIPIFFAINLVVLRKIQARAETTVTLLLSGIISMAVVAPLALPLQATAWDLLLLALMGSVQLGLGCMLMMAAAPRLAAAEIGLLSILETLFGTFSTWAFVGETPAWTTLGGGAVVMGALIINEIVGMRRHTLSPSEEQAMQSPARP